MSKTQDEFLDQFARLGVFSKVQALMGPENENEKLQTSNTTATNTPTSAVAITASDSEPGTSNATQNVQSTTQGLKLLQK